MKKKSVAKKLKWFRKMGSGEKLLTHQWACGFHRILSASWVTERLLLHQHGLYFTGKIITFCIILIWEILLNQKKKLRQGALIITLPLRTCNTFSRKYYSYRSSETRVTGKVLFLRIHRNKSLCVGVSSSLVLTLCSLLL